MKVTVCQLRNDADGLEADWERLVQHAKKQASQLVLLPEMPFSPWPAWRPTFDRTVWARAVANHESWTRRFARLEPAVVVGTRPVNVGPHRYNQGFAWDSELGLRTVHTKVYLPDEQGFWEASWYEPGEKRFEAFECGPAKAGMLICTEMWFTEHARDYARQGIHLLLTPRATERGTRAKWLAGGQAAAIMAGAYGLSSCPVNDREHTDDTGASLGGQGWIISPDGDVLATTSADEPFVTLDVDLALAEQAKSTYPRYVEQRLAG